MNWYGSGFITIILYATGGAAALNENELLTENNLDILTELSQSILTE
jgi:hypothetical protein